MIHLLGTVAGFLLESGKIVKLINSVKHVSVWFRYRYAGARQC